MQTVTDKWAAMQLELDRRAAEIERLRAALEMICGRRPCPDNLLGNADIARLAIDNIARKALEE